MSEGEFFDWSRVKVRQVIGNPPRKPAGRRAKLAKTWAKIPHDRGLRLARRLSNPVLAVLLVLEHAVHNAGSNRVKLTNYLFEQYGIGRQSKYRGLRLLISAGVITIERREGTSPTVTHNWYTESGRLK